jgi:hypothetical protein
MGALRWLDDSSRFALLVLGNAHADPAMWSVAGTNTVYLFGSVHCCLRAAARSTAPRRRLPRCGTRLLRGDTSRLDEATTTDRSLARSTRRPRPFELLDRPPTVRAAPLPRLASTSRHSHRSSRGSRA